MVWNEQQDRVPNSPRPDCGPEPIALAWVLSARGPGMTNGRPFDREEYLTRVQNVEKAMERAGRRDLDRKPGGIAHRAESNFPSVQ